MRAAGIADRGREEPPDTPGKHRDWRRHSDAHRCCGKSLMEGALMRVGVRYW